MFSFDVEKFAGDDFLRERQIHVRLCREQIPIPLERDPLRIREAQDRRRCVFRCRVRGSGLRCVRGTSLADIPANHAHPRRHREDAGLESFAPSRCADEAAWLSG